MGDVVGSDRAVEVLVIDVLKLAAETAAPAQVPTAPADTSGTRPPVTRQVIAFAVDGKMIFPILSRLETRG